MIHKNDEHRKKYIHQYYLDHADIMKDRSRKYYADHKEERSAKMKAWRIENHEYVLEKDKEYHHQHKDDPEYRRKRYEYKKEYDKTEKGAAQVKKDIVKYRLSHPDKVNKWHCDYRIRNHGNIVFLHREWARKNYLTDDGRERVLLNSKLSGHKRRMKIKSTKDTLTREEYLSTRALYDRCVYCNRKMENLTMDHIVPVISGGSNSIDNITFACKSCNSKKSSKSLLLFLLHRRNEAQYATR
jgi:5-methylcytosine-specific restriction endonuclease McrA